MNRRSMFKFLAFTPLLAVGACKPRSCPPTAPPLPEKPERWDFAGLEEAFLPQPDFMVVHPDMKKAYESVLTRDKFESAITYFGKS